MKFRAFTIIEILVVLAIIAIVAGILQPVFMNVRSNAAVQSSASRLRQLQMAVELYRVDHDLQGFGVDQYPPRADVYARYFGLGEDFFRSPCGYKDGIESNLKRLSYQYIPVEHPQIVAHYERYRESAVLFLDPHCNTLQQWDSSYTSKRKLAVLAGGRIVNELARGSTTHLEWWLPRNLNRQ